MKYFYPKHHALHKPSIDLSDGLPGYKHLEVASRVDLVLEGLLKAYEAEVVYVEGVASERVRSIHDDDYVDFLLAIGEELEGEEEYVPPLFRQDLSKSPRYFQGGMYSNEIGTPIGKESIYAALNSAQSALEGAKYLLESAHSAFVLNRPPGHHAGRRTYGGYCFFNNAYLAAQLLVEAGKRVRVLDIDYHIGDGSMEFASQAAPYASLHANTLRNYPYLDTTHQEENPYVSLETFSTGISGEEYVAYVANFIEKNVQERDEVIVLSLGFDTLESDYTQDEYIYVKTENFRTIGRVFGALKQEVLILLEGGYDSENLALCAQEFMSGFLSQKKE